MSSTQSAQVAQRRATVMDLAQSHGWKVAELKVPSMVAGYTSAPTLVAWRAGERVLVTVRSAKAAQSPLSSSQQAWIDAWGGEWLHVDTSAESLLEAQGRFGRSVDPSGSGSVQHTAGTGPLPEGAES